MDQSETAQQRLYDVVRESGAALEKVEIARGDTLIRQDTAADALYLVEIGRFDVLRDGQKLAEIGPGETVGEIALFTGGTRTADVIAARDSVVYRFAAEAYETALTKTPAFSAAVARVLARRLAETSARAVPVKSAPITGTIAVLAAGDHMPPDPVVAMLGSEMSALTDARVLRKADAPDSLGGRMNSAEAIAWLHEEEAKGGTLIYQADADDADWTQLILRQSDHLLIVGSAGKPPALSNAEKTAFEIFPEDQRRLALVHPTRSDWVTGTEDWLETRPVFMHHHLADGAIDDVARLARFLTGNANGYVAGGGGAFGAIHIGVHEALRKRGVPFDIYGGTSVGSAMCGGFAMGLTGDEMNERSGDIFVKNAALGKLTVPKYSMLDHTVLDRQLKKHFSDRLIENLWMPYFAVATDLSDNSARVIRRGPLWQAVRASSAIPGVLPPFYTEDGAMLVDGGSMTNLPVAQMHRLKNGPNVLVSFDRGERQTFSVKYDRLPGRWTLLRRTFLPIGKKSPRAPGILSVVMRSILARQASDPGNLKAGDWYIRALPMKGANFMNWKLHSKLYEQGKTLVDTLLSEDYGPDDPRAHLLGKDARG